MQRLSSNSTLMLKFFIPVFWIVFFGALTIAALAYQYEYVGNTPSIYFKGGMAFAYVTGVLLFAFTLLRLKRVEADEAFLYVTNYFKTARYPFHAIKEIRQSRFLFLSIARIQFVEKGIFGPSCFFVASRKLMQEYLEQHPDVQEKVIA